MNALYQATVLCWYRLFLQIENNRDEIISAISVYKLSKASDLEGFPGKLFQVTPAIPVECNSIFH